MDKYAYKTEYEKKLIAFNQAVIEEAEKFRAAARKYGL